MKPTFGGPRLILPSPARDWKEARAKIEKVTLRSFPLDSISNLVILHIFLNCFWNFIEFSRLYQFINILNKLCW